MKLKQGMASWCLLHSTILLYCMQHVLCVPEPNIPTDLAVSSQTTTSLTVTWQAATHGEFDHYKIQIDSQDAVQIEKDSNREHTFVALSPGTSHNIRLWVEAGDESSDSVQLDNINTGKSL